MVKTTITSITQYDPRMSVAAFAAEVLGVGNVVIFDGNGKFALGANNGDDMAKLTVPLLIGCTAAEATAGGQPAFLTGITKGKGKTALQMTVGKKVYPVSDGIGDSGEVTDAIGDTQYASGDMAVIGIALPNKGILIDTHIDWMEDIGA